MLHLSILLHEECLGGSVTLDQESGGRQKREDGAHAAVSTFTRSISTALRGDK